MSAEGGTTFELPFQWDDGTFVSPFVRSAASGLPPLGQYIATHLSTHPPVPTVTTSGREEGEGTADDHKAAVVVQDNDNEEWIITDLGCGDGTALFGIVSELTRLLSVKTSNGEPLSHSVTVKGVGYDLDSDLVDLAGTLVPPGASDHQYQFFVKDLGQVAANDVLMESAVRCRHVVFVYLLTSALEVLRDLMEDVLRKVELLISNSWSIPYFEDHLVARVGEHWVYRWSGNSTKARESDSAQTNEVP